MDPATGITELEAAQELLRLQSEEIAKLMEQRRVMLDALRGARDAEMERAIAASDGLSTLPPAPAWYRAVCDAIKFGGEG